MTWFTNFCKILSATSSCAERGRVDSRRPRPLDKGAAATRSNSASVARGSFVCKSGRVVRREIALEERLLVRREMHHGPKFAQELDDSPAAATIPPPVTMIAAPFAGQFARAPPFPPRETLPRHASRRSPQRSSRSAPRPSHPCRNAEVRLRARAFADGRFSRCP